MSKENESEISILKNSINLALGDESIVAEFERQFLGHDTSIFKDWERSRLEQFAALQYLRAYFRKATLMLLLKQTKQHIKLTHSELKTLESLLKKSRSNEAIYAKHANIYKKLATLLNEEREAKIAVKSKNAKKAVNARHDKPGGSRHMTQQIRDIWKSGKYTTRDICAEQECAGLGISYAKARRALRNTLDNS